MRCFLSGVAGLALLLASPSAAHSAELPGRYFRLLAVELPAIDKRLASEPKLDLATIEAKSGDRHFPGAILAAAVLYAKKHPDNSHHGQRKHLDLALRIGDLLAGENEKGAFQKRLDHDWDLYMWLEAYRLLDRELGDARRARWRKEIEKNVQQIADDAIPRVDFPRYQGPFIRTSTNHYSLWASTVHLAGVTFGNKEWEGFGKRAMHRLAAEEQTPDGYWGEHTDNGPTTGYNYLTMTGVALYYEHSHDKAALEALRRATDFHAHFTYPDGTPVEVINGRNRHWVVSAWGHFGFSHFADGRRYAEFLTRFLPEGKVGYHALGRLAQSALYYHEGPTKPIPQDGARYARRMTVPAGIRKSGPWVVCLSGLIDTPTESQFTLDRQGHLSVFHEKLGLIITGANSKRQPELATFVDRSGGQVAHLPTSSRLRMGDDRDRLGLAYPTFFGEVEVPTPSAKQATIRVTITETGRNRLKEAQLTLQLCLKAGEVLEAGKSSVTLSDRRVELGPEELGGVIRHRGWVMKVDPGARLTWPVYPFNPYRNAPETALRHAVAALTVPIRVKPPTSSTLPWRTQEFAFTLEAPREIPRKSEGPAPEATRVAIDHGIGFLEKEGVAWMKKKRCASCHHVPMMVWALNEARNRGHRINEKALGEVTSWALAAENHARVFQDLPVDEKRTEKDYLGPLFMSLAVGASKGRDPALEKGRQRLLTHAVSQQEKDGSWHANGEGRPPVHASRDIQTSWLFLALSDSAAPKGEGDPWETQRAAASRWLASNPPADNVQALAMRLLVLQRVGKSGADTTPLVESLLRQQNPDGGWAQSRTTDSDAFATGLALAASSERKDKGVAEAVRRAQGFLVRTQGPDGSWPMTSRPSVPSPPGPAKNLGPIKYFGTAWATIGLIRSGSRKGGE